MICESCDQHTATHEVIFGDTTVFRVCASCLVDTQSGVVSWTLAASTRPMGVIS
jgi:protein-arginine kinase activator protein McsA